MIQMSVSELMNPKNKEKHFSAFQMVLNREKEESLICRGNS